MLVFWGSKYLGYDIKLLKAKLQKEFDFIEALKQINIAAALTKRGPRNITRYKSSSSFITSYVFREARAYKNINAKLENVPSNHADFQFVQQLIKDTHGRVKNSLIRFCAFYNDFHFWKDQLILTILLILWAYSGLKDRANGRTIKQLSETTSSAGTDVS